MPFNPNTIGIREGIVQVLRTLLQEKLSDLQTALTSVTPSLLLPSTITSGQVVLGDPQKLPDKTAYPFWVALTAGGRQDSQDAAMSLYASGGILQRTYLTNIFFYIHPKSFFNDDVFAQAEQRERLRCRFQDWLCDDVLNTYANLSLTLPSQTFTPGAWDTLDEAYIREIQDGEIEKSFGGSEMVPCAHYVHACVARAAV